MKYQSLFSGNNKKIFKLLSAKILPSTISVKKWELVLVIKLVKNTYCENFPDVII